MSIRRLSLLRTVLAILVIAVGTTLPTVGPAEAGPAPGADPRLTLIEQTPWVSPNAPFSITLAADQPVAPDGDITVRLREPVASRAEFTIGLGEAGPGPIATTLVVPSALALTTDDRIRLEIPTTATGPLPVSVAGVHPLDITVDLADGSTVTLLTHLVRLPATDDRPPLRVAVIVPIGSEPILRASGALRTTRPSVSRVDRRVSALADEPDVPLTVIPVPETMESLATTPRGGPIVSDLAASLEGRQLLSSTYVELDEAEWVAAGLLEALDQQLAAGEAAITETLGDAPDRTVRYLTPPPGAGALQQLTEAGMEQAVVSARALTENDRASDGLPFPGPVLLAAGPTRVPAAVTDPDLQAHIDRTGDQVLDAQRTLADLATIAFDRSDEPSGVVLTLAERAGLPTGYLPTLLTGLTDGPVQPVTISDWFAQVSPTPALEDAATPDEALVRQVADRPVNGLGSYPDALAVTDLALAGLSNLTDGDDPSLPDLRRRTLVSGSSALTPPARSGYLANVGSSIRERTQQIQAAENQTVTLTSRRGRIPVAVRNDLGIPARVRLTVSSDRLEFPEGSRIDVVLTEEVTTIEVPVEARTTGSFKMDVVITSPDDVLAITSTQVTIRSTAISGVGLVLSIGAGLVLLTWWLRHWRDRRRDHRLIPAAEE